MSSFSNRTFDEIQLGETVTRAHRLTRPELQTLSYLTGDVDLFQADAPAVAAAGQAIQALAAEVILAALLHRDLPGPGTRVLVKQLRYSGSVAVGDDIVGTVTARAKRNTGHEIDFDCLVTRNGDPLITGTATVAAPSERIEYHNLVTPEIVLRHNDAFAHLLMQCAGMPPVVCAIVHPCDHDSLCGPIEAAKLGLIDPVLVGPEAKIRAVAEAAGVDLSPYRIVPTEHSHAAADKAVAMARAGEVQALMKGSLHTDELMAAVPPACAPVGASAMFSCSTCPPTRACC